ATAKTFRPIGDKVMAMGTRCHQSAMFIVYESPIQIFSGNPSQGLLEPEFMKLVGSIPTVWDTTIVIDAKLGDYIITARKKGDDWFIGAMCDWSPRELSVELPFLEIGNYRATLLEDGVNADRYASDYKLSKRKVSKSDKIPVKMAPGGGFIMRLQKEK
ncbi:MAG TPA: glycoside hydrolase family 97 C-terminal domain-containing protein, partial [Chitinophagaceae bacterium]|nr:glycoside hydrolase family 97 C-terminal domain-containing protein [Chitinophagaceae bacterium]